MTTASETEDHLDGAFSALSDRTRRAIIRRLARGEATVGELAKPFDMTPQAISQHVGILRDRGLITQRVEGQKRPCRLNLDRFRELETWIADQQKEWEGRLDHLESHLEGSGGRSK